MVANDTGIINRHFDAMVTSFYRAPFTSSVRHFKGTLIARAFGREGNATDHGLLGIWNEAGLDTATVRMESRFIFGQAY